MVKRIILCLLLIAFLASVLMACSDDLQGNIDDQTNGNESQFNENTTMTESVADPSWGGDPTGNDMVIEPVPAEKTVCLYYDGQTYSRFRCAVDGELIRDGVNFTYVGNVTEAASSHDVLSAENVPVGTQVFVSDDGSTVRVEFGGLIYYCAVKDEDDVLAKRPSIVYNGKHYVSDLTSTGGEAWSFEPGDGWNSVGFMNSVVYDRIPEFDNETNITELFGMLIYYNKKEDRLAIRVKDADDAYSDVDWQIYVWDGKE